MINHFDDQLRGGNPNSLGNTVAVVETVLAEPALFEDLFDCYHSDDPVVRLRVSNAMKRIHDAQPALVEAALPRFFEEVVPLEQPSAQWTLAQLWGRMTKLLSAEQYTMAKQHLQTQLYADNDWIVLHTTMQTLTQWAATDPALAAYLAEELPRFTTDKRKSIRGRAEKCLARLAKLTK